MCTFLVGMVAFNKATNGQTDKQHDNDDNVYECNVRGSFVFGRGTVAVANNAFSKRKACH